jgi:hypothetical protein
VRVNLLYTVLFVSLFILPVFATAQENEHRIPRDYNSPAIQPPSEEIFNELNNLVEEESRPMRPTPGSYLAKDSMATRSYTNPVHRGKSGNDQQRNSEDNSKNFEKEGSDSILSFNFIYYFFRKFKLSDIVDENK